MWRWTRPIPGTAGWQAGSRLAATATKVPADRGLTTLPNITCLTPHCECIVALVRRFYSIRDVAEEPRRTAHQITHCEVDHIIAARARRLLEEPPERDTTSVPPAEPISAPPRHSTTTPPPPPPHSLSTTPSSIWVPARYSLLPAIVAVSEELELDLALGRISIATHPIHCPLHSIRRHIS